MRRLAGTAVLAVVLAAAAACGGGSRGSVDPNTGLPAGSDPTIGEPAPDTSPTTSPSPPGQSKSYKFDGHGANVDASMFGKKWPLTIKSGRVNCLPVAGGLTMVVFTADNNDRYAVNGTARSRAASFGLKDVTSVWADDPQNPGLKKDIGVLIDVCAPVM